MKSQLNTDLLRSRLKLKSLQAEKQLAAHHPVISQFKTHAANLLTSGALASTLLVSAHAGMPAQAATALSEHTLSITIPQDLSNQLKNLLASAIPKEIRTLNPDEEDKVSAMLEKVYGIKAKASLDGNKLNDDYGRMGAEQHLPRWPGDTAAAHGEFVNKGITPGLGGWGYVEDAETEKWYVAVQTLYLPNWSTDTKKLSDWYKFRRVVVINPVNGKVVVAAVADAGPSIWTGKKFGGSPEVMAYLGINYGMQNHPVILFFLDDPEKKIPLGPVEYNINDEKNLL
ncbi:hypothetical protein M1403_01750 [Patescibacteria group bacterium]|nr:hypothetical protein [Patescibacteria group bacterium]